MKAVIQIAGAAESNLLLELSGLTVPEAELGNAPIAELSEPLESSPLWPSMRVPRMAARFLSSVVKDVARGVA